MIDTGKNECNFTVEEKEVDLENTYKILTGTERSTHTIKRFCVAITRGKDRYDYWYARIYKNTKTNKLYCTVTVNLDHRCRRDNHITLFEVKSVDISIGSLHFDFKVEDTIEVLFIPRTGDTRRASIRAFASLIREQEDIIKKAVRNMERCVKEYTKEKNQHIMDIAYAESKRLYALYYDSILTE